MEMEKVILKHKLNDKGTHHIAYCDEYPQIQGTGPSPEQATASFWRAFNKAQDVLDFESAKNKKSAMAAASASNKGKQKKAA
ncbi:MAG: hypothetical protein A2202_06125 [Bdellovibrionales bacterium RIFOXYA1_FULL_36_14]|nr:MAG: hypothetical protein A2202_06125 [Bdellovibrionales bacterium RIFOXYA1_FULL_36_14]